MNCPAHYRALGVAVTNGENVPDGEVYCIKASFTEQADWQEELDNNPTDDVNADRIRSGSRNRNLNSTSFMGLIVINEFN